MYDLKKIEIKIFCCSKISNRNLIFMDLSVANNLLHLKLKFIYKTLFCLSLRSELRSKT
jgi:hypothetical protein